MPWSEDADRAQRSQPRRVERLNSQGGEAMQSYTVARQILFLGAVPWSTRAVTILASAIGLAVSLAAGWPLWVAALAGILPWMPALAAEISWIQRNYPGLALFYVLVVSQGGHFTEHLWQM